MAKELSSTQVMALRLVDQSKALTTDPAVIASIDAMRMLFLLASEGTDIVRSVDWKRHMHPAKWLPELLTPARMSDLREVIEGLLRRTTPDGASAAERGDLHRAQRSVAEDLLRLFDETARKLLSSMGVPDPPGGTLDDEDEDGELEAFLAEMFDYLPARDITFADGVPMPVLAMRSTLELETTLADGAHGVLCTLPGMDPSTLLVTWEEVTDGVLVQAQGRDVLRPHRYTMRVLIDRGRLRGPGLAVDRWGDMIYVHAANDTITRSTSGTLHALAVADHAAQADVEALVSKIAECVSLVEFAREAALLDRYIVRALQGLVAPSSVIDAGEFIVDRVPRTGEAPTERAVPVLTVPWTVKGQDPLRFSGSVEFVQANPRGAPHQGELMLAVAGTIDPDAVFLRFDDGSDCNGTARCFDRVRLIAVTRFEGQVYPVMRAFYPYDIAVLPEGFGDEQKGPVQLSTGDSGVHFAVSTEVVQGQGVKLKVSVAPKAPPSQA